MKKGGSFTRSIIKRNSRFIGGEGDSSCLRIDYKSIAFRCAQCPDYFLQESKKATDIKTNIETTDRGIDKMVYALYELTEEEIGIVEG